MTTEDNTQEELRDLIDEMHMCQDDGYGCEYENFEALGRTYTRCKLREDSFKRIKTKTIADRKAQASKLLDAIEKRGPEDITGFESDRYEIGVEDGFDRSNKEWRSLLKELRKELCA